MQLSRGLSFRENFRLSTNSESLELFAFRGAEIGSESRVPCVFAAIIPKSRMNFVALTDLNRNQFDCNFHLAKLRCMPLRFRIKKRRRQ